MPRSPSPGRRPARRWPLRQPDQVAALGIAATHGGGPGPAPGRDEAETHDGMGDQQGDHGRARSGWAAARNAHLGSPRLVTAGQRARPTGGPRRRSVLSASDRAPATVTGTAVLGHALRPATSPAAAAATAASTPARAAGRSGRSPARRSSAPPPHRPSIRPAHPRPCAGRRAGRPADPAPPPRARPATRTGQEGGAHVAAEARRGGAHRPAAHLPGRVVEDRGRHLPDCGSLGRGVRPPPGAPVRRGRARWGRRASMA